MHTCARRCAADLVFTAPEVFLVAVELFLKDVEKAVGWQFGRVDGSTVFGEKGEIQKLIVQRRIRSRSRDRLHQQKR